MPQTPFQAQSRYEGARRPWSLTAKPARKDRGAPYQYKGKPEEIRLCLSCPLPECKVNWCPILRASKQKNKGRP